MGKGEEKLKDNLDFSILYLEQKLEAEKNENYYNGVVSHMLVDILIISLILGEEKVIPKWLPAAKEYLESYTNNSDNEIAIIHESQIKYYRYLISLLEDENKPNKSILHEYVNELETRYCGNYSLTKLNQKEYEELIALLLLDNQDQKVKKYCDKFIEIGATKGSLFAVINEYVTRKETGKDSSDVIKNMRVVLNKRREVLCNIFTSGLPYFKIYFDAIGDKSVKSVAKAMFNGIL